MASPLENLSGPGKVLSAERSAGILRDSVLLCCASSCQLQRGPPGKLLKLLFNLSIKSLHSECRSREFESHPNYQSR
jgi:hypothetical protein